MISVSSFILTPIALRNACVRASVLDISIENISLAAMDANGVSSPSVFAIPCAIAVFPVPGAPAISTPRPAIVPSRIIFAITPAAKSLE